MMARFSTPMMVILCLILVDPGCTATYDRTRSGVFQVIKRLGEARTEGDLHVSQGRSRSGDSPIYYIKLPPTPYFYMQNIASAFGLPQEKVPVDFTNNGRPNQVYHFNLPELHSQIINPSPSVVPNPSTLTGIKSTIGSPYATGSETSFGHAELNQGSSPEYQSSHTGGSLHSVPNSPLLNSAVSPSTYQKPQSASSYIIQENPSGVSSVDSPSLGYHKPLSPIPSTAQKIPSSTSDKKTWISSPKTHYSYNGRPANIYIFKSKRPINKNRRPLGKLLRY